jgi:hypothetical protein
VLSSSAPLEDAVLRAPSSGQTADRVVERLEVLLSRIRTGGTADDGVEVDREQMNNASAEELLEILRTQFGRS